jgi:hypothetical protein
VGIISEHRSYIAGRWISVVKNRIGHLPPETQYKLLRGNAERVYRFTPAAPPVLAGA